MNWRFASLVLLILLAGCAARRGPAFVPESADRHWRLEGRLAVSDGRDSGSGSISWEQDGDYFTISLRAPISGQSWRLSGDADQCALEGLKPYPLIADTPEQLLERELGWHLPVAPLRSWLRGVPLDPSTGLERDALGHVTGFSEAGWTIGYRDFRDGRPTRITAHKPPHQVRLAIKSWIALP
jgi:outer membrane lipoprotein LolB